MKWIIAEERGGGGALLTTRENWDQPIYREIEPDSEVVLEFEANSHEEAREVFAKHQGWVQY